MAEEMLSRLDEPEKTTRARIATVTEDAGCAHAKVYGVSSAARLPPSSPPKPNRFEVPSRCTVKHERITDNPTVRLPAVAT